jgi:hypothetical protein
MPMKKSIPAVNPDAYVAALTGWQRSCVEKLRAAVRTTPTLEEQVKWGHLVYLSNGPALLIRAEEERVLFGFWRGKRLLDIEKRLEPSGMYEMATLKLTEGMTVSAAKARELAKKAVELNHSIGNPIHDAKPKKALKRTATVRRAKRARKNIATLTTRKK